MSVGYTAFVPMFRATPLLRSRAPLRLRCTTPVRQSSAQAQGVKVWENVINGMKEAKTFKTERVITSKQNAAITVAGTNGPVLNFCANNYLGLSADEALVKAGIDTMNTHGLGLSSVRFICGTQDIHKELERKISEFHGTEDTILYPSCFDANAGIFEALLEPEDAVFSDSLNHASIIDGLRLCKAQKFIFKHMDMADLEEKLSSAQARLKLIVTDGVFSMDGDIAPLKRITELAEKHQAMVMIDECHATGFLGKTGRGTPELMGVSGKIDLINSTLGKALGGASGGYTTGPKAAITLLRNKSRPYLFSNSLAPALVGASIKMFDMISTSTERRDRLEANTKLFRTLMSQAGFKLAGSPDSPIAPVMLGDAGLASEMANRMLAKGQARIRVQLSAAHTEEHIRQAVAAFTAVGKELGVVN